MNNGYRLDKAIEELERAYKSAHEIAEKAATELAQARSDEKHIMTALRALAPEHEVVQNATGPAASRPGPKPKPTRPVYNIKPELFETVWAWVRARDAEPFTRAEAKRAVDSVSDDLVSRSLDKLREAEAIRKIGADPVRGGKTDRFKLLDEQAGDRALQDNADAYNPAR